MPTLMDHTQRQPNPTVIYQVTDQHPPLTPGETTARLEVILDQIADLYTAITAAAPEALRLIRTDRLNMEQAEYMAALAANHAASAALQAGMAHQLVWEGTLRAMDMPGSPYLLGQITDFANKIKRYYAGFIQTWRGYTATGPDLLG